MLKVPIPKGTDVAIDRVRSHSEEDRGPSERIDAPSTMAKFATINRPVDVNSRFNSRSWRGLDLRITCTQENPATAPEAIGIIHCMLSAIRLQPTTS